jgi:hypothetical protein
MGGDDGYVIVTRAGSRKVSCLLLITFVRARCDRQKSVQKSASGVESSSPHSVKSEIAMIEYPVLKCDIGYRDGDADRARYVTPYSRNEVSFGTPRLIHVSASVDWFFSMLWINVWEFVLFWKTNIH